MGHNEGTKSDQIAALGTQLSFGSTIIYHDLANLRKDQCGEMNRDRMEITTSAFSHSLKEV